jgi:hypothetical protein
MNMTNFYPEYVLIDGQQAEAARYFFIKRTKTIICTITYRDGHTSKVVLHSDNEQYSEAQAAWYEAYQEWKAAQTVKAASDPSNDIFELMSADVDRPEAKPLESMPEAAHAEPAKENVIPAIIGKGFRVVFNEELGRTQILFSSFPCQEAREIVKEAGFFWSPVNKAWQKKLNGKAQRAAEEVAAKLAGMKIAA